MGYLKGIFVKQEQYEMLLEIKKANKLRSMAQALEIVMPMKKQEEKKAEVNENGNEGKVVP